MAKNRFTQEQIEKLRLNPYTYSVNTKHHTEASGSNKPKDTVLPVS